MTDKNYCSIRNYIVKNHTDLFQILEDTCLLGAVTGTKNTTFLLPTGKFHEQLMKLKPFDENTEKLWAELTKLIISGRDLDLTTPEKWMKNKNVLIKKYNINVEVDSKNNVKLNGIPIKPKKDFVPMKKKFNGKEIEPTISVWEISSSLLSTINSVTGEYEPSSTMKESFRYRLGLTIENEYAQKKRAKDLGSKTGAYLPLSTLESCKCAYLNAIISLLYFIHKNDKKLFYERVAPLISFQPIDFYILVEPHTEPTPDTKFLLSTELLEEWWYSEKPQILTKDAYYELINAIDTPPEEYLTYGCYKGHIRLHDALQSTRDDIMSSMDPKSMLNTIHKLYDNFEQTNNIGDLLNVYPEPLSEYYRSNPGLKMVHDELRYTTTMKFDQILNNSTTDLSDYKFIINYIAETLHANNKELRIANLIMLNKISLLNQYSQFERDFKIFINSPLFMYIPLKSNEILNYPIRQSGIAKPALDDDYIWNIERVKLSTHERIIPGFKVSDLALKKKSNKK